MKMDTQLYQQLILAIEVSYSSIATSDERNAAFQFCEEFKTRQDCAIYAVALYQNPISTSQLNRNITSYSTDIYKRQHFALHVLEHYVLTRWRELQVSEQTQLRIEVFNLLLQQTSNEEEINEIPLYLREKKVALIAAIAKRQFPQRWPEFIVELLQLCQNGNTNTTELGLMILRSIGEDCVSSNFNTTIPPARRKDILQGLNASLTQLLPFLYYQVETQYAQYLSIPLDQSNAKENCKRLIHAALQVVKEFLEWMPVDLPLDTNSNLINAAVVLLDQSEFRFAAAECLECYLSRHFGKDGRKYMLQSMDMIICRMVHLNLEDFESTTDLEIVEQNIHMHGKLNDMLVAWGTSQFDLSLQFVNESTESELLGRILQTMSRLFCHPSLILTERQVIVWLNVFKQQKLLQKIPSIAPVIETIRRVAFEKYFKLGSPDRLEYYEAAHLQGSNTSKEMGYELEMRYKSALCNSIEFDDQHECMAFYGNLRGRLYALIRQIVRLDPTTSLQMVSNQLNYILTNYRTATDFMSEENSTLGTEQSTAYLYHEGITALIDCVVKQVPKEKMSEISNKQIVLSMVQNLLQFDTPQPLLKYRQLLAISSFAPFYSLYDDGEILNAVFELLFANIVYVLPGEEPHGTMSQNTMNVRRRALGSLVSICKAIPQHILPVLPILCTKTQDLITSERVVDSEAVLLYEMLVLVSNSIENSEERTLFVQQIIQDPLSRWTSAEMTSIVSSPQSLTAAVEAAAKDPAPRKLLSQILKCLTTIYGVAKRVSVANSTRSFDGASFVVEPFATSWPYVLPNLFRLIDTLHSLYNTQTKAILRNATTSSWLLNISTDELAQFLGGRHQLDEDEIVKLPLASKWAKWQKSVRDICYHILGLAVTQPSWYGQSQVQSNTMSFSQCILSHIQFMEHRHLKTAISTILLPLTKSCPLHCYSSILDPLLVHFFAHMESRLSICCSLDANNGLEFKQLWGATIVGIDDVKQEIVREKMTTDIVRQFIEFIDTAIDPKVVVGADTDSPKHITSNEDRYLTEFILYQQKSHLGKQLPNTTGATLVHIIGWKDSYSCRKAILLCDKIVNFLFADSYSHEFLGRILFSATLKALLLPVEGLSQLSQRKRGSQENGLNWDMINLVRNIYCRLVLGVLPVEECKGIDPAKQPLVPTTSLYEVPRQILLSLPGISTSHIETLDTYLRENHSVKSQKNAMKELLDLAVYAIQSTKESSPLTSVSKNQIDDLPEQLTLVCKDEKLFCNTREAQETNLDSTWLFQR